MQSLANTSLYTHLQNHKCPDDTAPCFAKLCFVNALQGLYVGVNKEKTSVTLGNEFLKLFPQRFQKSNQEDPEEFFLELYKALSACQTSLVLAEQVGFTTETRSVCKNFMMECKSVAVGEHNLCLELEVHRTNGGICVQDLVSSYFQVGLVHRWCNCDNLKHVPINSYQYSAIKAVGQVLVVYLKRAHLNVKHRHLVKLSHKLIIPGYENLEYRLCAVTCHKGNSQASGHYVSLILKTVTHPEVHMEWYLADNHSVALATVRDWREAEKDSCMLFYQCVKSDSSLIPALDASAAFISLSLSETRSNASRPSGGSSLSSLSLSLPTSDVSPSPGPTTALSMSLSLSEYDALPAQTAVSAAGRLVVVLGMSPTCASDKIRIKAFLLSNPVCTVLTVAHVNGCLAETGHNNWVHCDCDFKTWRGVDTLVKQIRSLNFPKLCTIVVLDFFFLMHDYYKSRYGTHWLEDSLGGNKDSVGDLLKVVNAVYLVENKGNEVKTMVEKSMRNDLSYEWLELSTHVLWETSSSETVTNELQTLNPQKADARYQMDTYLTGKILQIKLIMPSPDVPSSLSGNADNDASSGPESADSGSIDERIALPVRYELLRPCECRRTGRQVIDPRYNQLRDERGNRVFFCKCGDTYRFL